MKSFFAYLRHRRGALALYALSVGVFAATFALYELPLRAVWYPAALCAVMGAGALARGFLREKRQREALMRIRSAEELSLLPGAQSALEADYQRVVRLLADEQAAARTDAAARYGDMVDYYTVWAHQIKTPIASMRLALDGEDSALSRRLCGELGRVEQYVEMVLVFLRLDSPGGDYLFREYDVDAVVRRALRRFAGEFIGRGIRLSYEPMDLRAVTDEKWLSFVIEQVLSNALKYTPSGGSITVFREAPQTLCIRDTGMGIAAEDLPRIFEKGYTGCLGRVDRRASGIGLYLCRRVCTALGHGISAESAPGEGTCIRIDLSQSRVECE